MPGGKRPVAREPGNCAGESLRAPGERDNCPGENARCAGEPDNWPGEMARCPVEKAVFRGTRPGAEGKIPADARADTIVTAQRIAAADDGQMLLSLHFCFFNKSHFQNCGETAQPNRFPANPTNPNQIHLCCGVRGHVRALKLGDMSPSWKAATCRRTPNQPRAISFSTFPSCASSRMCSGIWPTAWVEQLKHGS